MKSHRLLVLAFPALLLFSGCYHATVETGRAPSGVVLERPWAASFIGGLVPPAAIEATTCANGVARVDTELSFVNMLVGGLTGGIYTPMSIRVQCAAAPTADANVLEGAADPLAALQEAADLSLASGEPVFVEF